jgi:hypothetical protein
MNEMKAALRFLFFKNWTVVQIQGTHNRDSTNKSQGNLEEEKHNQGLRDLLSPVLALITSAFFPLKREEKRD